MIYFKFKVVSNALAKMVSPEMGQLVLISMSVLKVATTVVRMLHASTDLVDSGKAQICRTEVLYLTFKFL